MLPTELLMFRVKGGVIEPKRLKPTIANLKLAETVIQTFEQHLGKRRFELDEEVRLLDVEGSLLVCTMIGHYRRVMFVTGADRKVCVNYIITSCNVSTSV